MLLGIRKEYVVVSLFWIFVEKTLKALFWHEIPLSQSHMHDLALLLKDDSERHMTGSECFIEYAAMDAGCFERSSNSNISSKPT